MEMSNKESSYALDSWIKHLTTNITQTKSFRMFADCSLIANLVKQNIPSLVQLHNYPVSSNNEQMKSNWMTFKQKVLKPLNIRISEEDIVRIIQVKNGQGRLLNALNDLFSSIENYKMKNNHFNKQIRTISEDDNEENNITDPKAAFYIKIIDEKNKEIEELNSLIKVH